MDTIRDFYVQKKRKWANCFDYYSPKRRWGEHDEYGFELAPPYSQEEVECCLQSKCITLPSGLYQYLTLVSREIFTDSYPVIFDLDTLPTKEQINQFVLPEGIDHVNENDFQSDDDPLESETLFNPEHWCHLMVKIGDGGCTFNQLIYLGAGSQHGSIWCYSDDMCYRREYNNFDTLLKNDMVSRTKI